MTGSASVRRRETIRDFHMNSGKAEEQGKEKKMLSSSVCIVYYVLTIIRDAKYQYQNSKNAIFPSPFQ